MTFTNSNGLMVAEEGNILLVWEEGERIMAGELKQKEYIGCSKGMTKQSNH